MPSALHDADRASREVTPRPSLACLSFFFFFQTQQTPAPEDPPHSTFLNKALANADALRKQAKDTHIAVDHLLLGILAEAEREVKR